VLEDAVDDHRAGELEECEVELGSAFPAGGDAPPVVQPCVCALDRPAVTRLRIAAFCNAAPAAFHHPRARLCRFAGFAAAADHRLDATYAQLATQLLTVVAAVCPQLERPPIADEQLVDKRQ
jgi:hypothetical protein